MLLLTRYYTIRDTKVIPTPVCVSFLTFILAFLSIGLGFKIKFGKEYTEHAQNWYEMVVNSCRPCNPVLSDTVLSCL
jgi:hypothetical protein